MSCSLKPTHRDIVDTIWLQLDEIRYRCRSPLDSTVLNVRDLVERRENPVLLPVRIKVSDSILTDELLSRTVYN